MLSEQQTQVTSPVLKELTEAKREPGAMITDVQGHMAPARRRVMCKGTECPPQGEERCARAQCQTQGEDRCARARKICRAQQEKSEEGRDSRCARAQNGPPQGEERCARARNAWPQGEEVRDSRHGHAGQRQVHPPDRHRHPLVPSSGREHGFQRTSPEESNFLWVCSRSKSDPVSLAHVPGHLWRHLCAMIPTRQMSHSPKSKRRGGRTICCCAFDAARDEVMLVDVEGKITFKG